MARDHARILVSIWNDGDWRELPPQPQWLYFALMSQKTINNAGVLPLQPTKWARGAKDVTPEDIQAWLAVLAEERFVVVDDETEEVLVRSFVRRDGVLKVPNVFTSALRQAVMTESPALRKVLAVELRRVGRRDAARTADELDPPTETPSRPEPVRTQSEHRPEPVESVDNPVDNNGIGTGSGMPSERAAGEGTGVGEGERSVGGQVGGSRAHASAREAANEPPPTPTPPTHRPTTRPPARCPQHLDSDDDRPCRACGTARQRAEAWDTAQAAAAKLAASTEARQRAEARRLAIQACPMCDDDGQIGKQLCDHDPTAAERAARGRQAVAAANSDRVTPTAPPAARRETTPVDPQDFENRRQAYLTRLAQLDEQAAAEPQPSEAHP